MTSLGDFINWGTEQQPFLMGIIVSVVMGMVLTLPISSAALGVSLGLSGISAGAACVGCSAQMIGFAVISYKDNGIGGFISQGVGTSMLQIGNIVRKPIIWLAPTLTAAILGPVSTVVFKMTNSSLGAGMGTSGLVGPLATFASMTEAGAAPGLLVAKIAILHFVAQPS